MEVQTGDKLKSNRTTPKQAPIQKATCNITLLGESDEFVVSIDDSAHHEGFYDHRILTIREGRGNKLNLTIKNGDIIVSGGNTKSNASTLVLKGAATAVGYDLIRNDEPINSAKAEDITRINILHTQGKNIKDPKCIIRLFDER